MNLEEREFYIKLGQFIKIMQSKNRLDNAINNCPKDNRIKELVSDEMLCNYKKGFSRPMDVAHELKFSEDKIRRWSHQLMQKGFLSPDKRQKEGNHSFITYCPIRNFNSKEIYKEEY